MSTLANQLAAAEREQVARAIRLLLARPLLTEATDPAGFELVRRRHEPLAQWFDYTCGWSLVVEPRRGYARLTKVRADPDGTRPARRARSGRAPFDRRRYVLLCVTAAELLSMPMTTIGMLADRVVQATSADRALAAFDPVHKPERMAFVDVLKLLESYDVLRAVDGTTEAYVESAEAKVLYRVDTTLLMRLPAAPVGASRLAVPPDEVPALFGELLTGLVRERRYGGAVTDGTADEAHGERAATDAQRNLRLRHSVLRRLFDDPVLYRTDLTDDELAYVTSLTGRQILRRSVEQAGFLLEERAEGFLLVDPDGLATDVRFPDDTSTARVAALLLLEPLCAAPAGLLPEQLAEAGADLLRRFPRWARAYQSEDGAARLSDDAVRVLRDVPGPPGRGACRRVPGRIPLPPDGDDECGPGRQDRTAVGPPFPPGRRRHGCLGRRRRRRRAVSVTELPVPRRPEPTAPAVAGAARVADATGSRWQPHRAGILNVWRYYDETFTFHQGRLLLRGQNGSGKSKALELLLPFLFDASLRPNRLSTFGGSERTMHWNLLGEGASGKTRVGYVWMEFRRLGDDGAERWFGCGARLQASVHTSTVHADYFTTGSRIADPEGVLLVNEAGQPLTRAALAEALRDRGDVHASATDYRTAVRRELFTGMGEQRYESLLSALLQLRQPKLSERLDPSLLSTLLSRALPPLGEAEIAELAEGFERLDRQREHLKRLDDEVTAAETVASRQRAYARRVLRASSAALISATTEMDNLTRVARQSAEELEQALAERWSAQARRQELELRAHALDETVEGLRESDTYRQGEELDRLRRRTEDVAAAAERQRAAAQIAQARSEEDQRHADEAADQARALREHAHEAAGEAHRAARAAGLESIHYEVRTVLDEADPAVALPHTTGPDQGGVPPTTAENGARQARRLLRGADTARRQQVTLVTEAIDAHDRAVRDRGAAEELLDEARTRLAEAIARRDEASAAWDDTLAAQVERLLAWAEDCAELRIADLDALAAGAAVEAEVTALTEAAARPLEQEIAAAEATTRAARQGLRDERNRLEEKLRQLSGETDLPPVPPPTRTTVRTPTAGAPLWRVVAFREGVPLPVQSAVEAALEASGLLDAWISPYDGLTLPGHDTRAEAALAATAPGPSLLEVLRPEEGIPLPADTVTRILAGIAYGPTLPGGHPAAVSADGAWRLALATGTWSKPEPAHIGVLARQRARQRMIGELTDRIGETNASLAALDDRLRGLAARRARLDADRAARPDQRELDARRRDRDRAEDTVAARDDAVRDVAGRLARCEREVAGALRALDRRAAEHGLPTDRARLRELSDAVGRFRDTADSWVDARLAATDAADRARRRAAQADRSRRTAEGRAEDAAAAEAEAAGLKARLEAVEATVGADYRQIVARVAEVRAELRRCREETGRAADLLLRLEGQVGELRATSGQDAERREQAVATRDAAAHRFRHLCLAGLAEDAGITPALDAGDGTKATLEAARATAATWPDIPHAPRNLGDAATRLSEAVHEARQHLGTRADLDLAPDDDIQLFTATLDGVRVGATGLLSTLTQERDRSRDDITAAERRLFDQILTGDIRRHLAARIRQAGELVDRMNGHLERVRTASNVAVQLVWDVRPDLPDSTRTARQLLLKDPGRVTESDREALHVFFRARIEEAKAGETAASWEEQLGEVLDYTAWHRFTVRLDRANGTGWQPLTKKLHGALSGGEKAIALHLPLFAAVAAHYEAVPLAPRPILLDEVFVGVDTVNRGQVFALLTALDLDLMVTSDHEWCTYGELPGIAVHQLLTGGDDDAVTSARFVWNGSDLEAG